MHVYVYKEKEQFGQIVEEVEDFSLGSIDEEDRDGPYLHIGNLSTPRGFYKSFQKFSISTKFKKNNLFGVDGLNLELEQEYLFTEYSGKEAHEPSGKIPAARFYPMVRFKFSFPPTEEQNLVKIRVDYRFNFYLDHYVYRMPLRIPSVFSPNQSGIWLDQDEVDIWRLAPGGEHPVFEKAEQPLVSEAFGQGIDHGKKKDWDNIHQWMVMYSAKIPRGGLPEDAQMYPEAPGVPYGIHMHWRWGEHLAELAPLYLSLIIPKAGPVFGGPKGKGGIPMIDPKIPNQNLWFAITQIDAKYKAEKYFSDSLGIRTRRPAKITAGGDMLTWFSLTAIRQKNKPFEGTLFTHGIFFAHNEEQLEESYSIDPLYLPHKPTGAQWHRL